MKGEISVQSIELVKKIVQILDKKKAEEIRVIEVSDITSLGDYFVISGADNTTKVKSLVDEVEYQTKQLGRYPARIEKDTSAQWVLLDYQDVIVHIFYRQAREFYDLEHLWADGKQIPLDDFLEGEETD